MLPHFYLGLLVLTMASAWLCTPRAFDVFALSAVGLGLNALLVCGLVRWLGDGAWNGDWLWRLLLVGLFAAGLLALSVSFILKCARHHAIATKGAAA